MIEKVIISLWEFFVYFLTGLFVSLLMLLHYYFYYGILKTQDSVMFKIPSILLVLILPTSSILIGLIIEPIANYYGRIILIIEKYLGKFSPNRDLRN